MEKENSNQSFDSVFATMLLGVASWEVGKYCSRITCKMYYKHQIKKWIAEDEKNLERYNNYVSIFNKDNNFTCKYDLIPENGYLSGMSGDQLFRIHATIKAIGKEKMDLMIKLEKEVHQD